VYCFLGDRYVEWSSHQPFPTEDYNFDGNLNLVEFIELAQKNNLLVILRPGPFIDAERDMVGNLLQQIIKKILQCLTN
jgi:beta-galactosidase